MTDSSVCCATKAVVLSTVSNFLFRPHPSRGEVLCFGLSFNKKEFQEFLKGQGTEKVHVPVEPLPLGWRHRPLQHA